ncbi:MAG: lipoyl synthase, partial [Planctomycetes bacterium]|nr:lipoyl synthase [Planctomycetota bacterium]
AEVLSALSALTGAGCDAVTIGQYLAPSSKHHPVVEFITPEDFDEIGAEARAMGFYYVASAPFVRSSYNAEETLDELRKARA